MRKVDKMVEEALRQSIKKSMSELAKAVGESKGQSNQLIQISLILDASKIDYRPTTKEVAEMIHTVSTVCRRESLSITIID